MTKRWRPPRRGESTCRLWVKPPRAGGLRVRGGRVHPEVRGAVVRFARWLRGEYAFPIRVPVYLSPRERLVTMHGDVVTAAFFAPWDPDVEPYIRVATGDYLDELRTWGRDQALAGYLGSVAHEVVHYFQWVRTGEVTERGVVVRARNIVDRYTLTVDHP